MRVKCLKNIFLLSLLLLLGCFSLLSYAFQTQSPVRSNFEIVESVPKGTIFGESNVRHTKQVWIDMINDARNTLDIGAFYLTVVPHSSIVPVIDAIKSAGKRGVKVRIILDQKFARHSQSSVQLLKGIPNIEMRYLPVGKLAGGVMHAKYMVVDGENTFVGSANFDWRALDQIHEIGVRIRNKALANTILNVFNLDWALCQTQDINQHQYLLFTTPKISLVTSERPVVMQNNSETLVIHPAFSPKVLLPMGLDWEQTQFVHLLNNAEHQVLMQVLLYSPDAGYHRKGYWAEMDNAIRSAAGRGVQVKMIVSNWALRKPGIDFIKSLSLVPNVEIKYSALPPYKHHFIKYARVEHCKYMVIDNDLSWIGTGNWQWGYFYNTRNLAIIINGQGPNKILRNIFFKDWDGPYVHKIDPDKSYKSPKTH